jgi:hypothetical protein
LLKEKSSEEEILFDNTNSPLVNSSLTEKVVNISALQTGSSGLWVANFNASPSLHLLKSDNTWNSFSLPNLQSQYPIEIVEDLSARIWMAVNPANGGGVIVFDPENNTTTLKNELPGTGGLLNRFARSLAVDLDGNVWVGTDAGLGYFYAPEEDAVIPIFENRYLLKDEAIADIEVDGGNRKWIATRHGAWLVGPTGESLVYNFTEANSPMLSDVVLDIEINPNTGEVFFATQKGIISFRGDATAGSEGYNAVKIFPNPVTPEFNGTVAISGLIGDSFVKITDVSGKLIWQGQAQGGTATWNVKDNNGSHARTGIYLVFASSPDGSESKVGKIAVVE